MTCFLMNYRHVFFLYDPYRHVLAGKEIIVLIREIPYDNIGYSDGLMKAQCTMSSIRYSASRRLSADYHHQII